MIWLERNEALCIGVVVILIVSVVSVYAYNRVTTARDSDDGPEQMIEENDVVIVDLMVRSDPGGVIYENNRLKLTVGTQISGVEKVINDIVNDRLMTMHAEGRGSFAVPPKKAFGEYDPALVEEFEYHQDIPLFETISIDRFTTAYADEPLKEGLVVAHHFWRFQTSVYEVNERLNEVTLRHQPSFGETIRVYPWSSEVVGISSASNKVTIEHHPSVGDWFAVNEKMAATLGDANLETDLFEVKSIAETENTIVLDFNHRYAGQTLIISIEILDVNTEYGIALTPYDDAHAIGIGRTTGFAILIENYGNNDDTVDVSIAEQPTDWTVELSFSNVALETEETRCLIVTCRAPKTAIAKNYPLVITGRSRSDPELESTARLELMAKTIGGRAVQDGDNVTVNYFGGLPTGELFDTSMEAIGTDADLPAISEFEYGQADRSGRFERAYRPLTITVGDMIEGFNEALIGMRVGETKVVTIPPEKAYGREGSGHRLSGETLIFQLTLLSFEE